MHTKKLALALAAFSATVIVASRVESTLDGGHMDKYTGFFARLGARQ